MGRKTVVILGMHRSGTSMAAGILHLLGVDMGSDLIGRMPSNPLGHFEDREFVALNEKILQEAGGSWDNPPVPEAVLRQFNRFRSEIKKLTGKHKRGICGWKDPRTCLTIELYLEFLSNPYLIIIHREAAAVARSLQKRNQFPLERGQELNRLYEERVWRFMQAHPEIPRLLLGYETVLESPRYWVNKIISFLGIKPGRRQIAEAVSFILTGQGCKPGR